MALWLEGAMRCNVSCVIHRRRRRGDEEAREVWLLEGAQSLERIGGASGPTLKHTLRLSSDTVTGCRRVALSCAKRGPGTQFSQVMFWWDVGAPSNGDLRRIVGCTAIGRYRGAEADLLF